jgi:hypothetical protein
MELTAHAEAELTAFDCDSTLLAAIRRELAHQ